MFSSFMYTTSRCHCIYSCPCQPLHHLYPYIYTLTHTHTHCTCKSRWAHLRFGSLCCLRRSLCQHHWKVQELWVFALCLLWKEKTVKSTFTLKKKQTQATNAHVIRLHVFLTLKWDLNLWAARLLIFCRTRPPAGAKEYLCCYDHE